MGALPPPQQAATPPEFFGQDEGGVESIFILPVNSGERDGLVPRIQGRPDALTVEGSRHV